MNKYEKFMKKVREYNKHKNECSSRGAFLREKIMNGNHTNEEWLALQEELREFIASKPSKEELAELQGCGESLAMICSAIRERRM